MSWPRYSHVAAFSLPVSEGSSNGGPTSLSRQDSQFPTNYRCRRKRAKAHTSFQVAISLSFIQQFWSQIRRKSFSAKQINAIIKMRNNSLSFSALKIFPSTVQLFAVALIIFSLSVLSVVIPGLSHSRPGFYWTKLLCSYKANTRMRLHGVLPPVLYHLYRNSRPKWYFLDHIYRVQLLVAYVNTMSPSRRQPFNVIIHCPHSSSGHF